MSEQEPDALRQLVRKGVVELLGREPFTKAEEIRTRMAIYKAHPGLQTAVVNEERRERLRRA